MHAGSTANPGTASSDSPGAPRGELSEQPRGELRSRLEQGLRRVTVPFPTLAPLVASAQLLLDARVPTMGVFASGRLLVNPQFAQRLSDRDLLFVLAHEMLHLALHTHERSAGSNPLQFNYAHDYIINDLLRHELGVATIPAGGLDMPGARTRSAEAILLEMRNDGSAPTQSQVWEGTQMTVRRRFGAGAQGESGNEAADAGNGGDVLDDAVERDWFGESRESQRARQRRVRALAVRARALARGDDALAVALRAMGEQPGEQTEQLEAERGAELPWQVALQRWLESVAMGSRSFLRPSRRGDTGVTILPGRKREGWLLNVVLDTSGSMTDELPRILGAIGRLSDTAGVDQVRVVQCDAAVTRDELIAPWDLARCEIAGFGGSDVTPALLHLAADPHVQAVMVITDGDISFPREAPPYSVLWALTKDAHATFHPGYGRVLTMQAEATP
jgi:predicted metal-dependent peptidase